jgi:hypothetical protein
MAALSSLYEYLCDRNAVTHNPKGVKRPRADSNEGKTPALGDIAYAVSGFSEAVRQQRESALIARIKGLLAKKDNTL